MRRLRPALVCALLIVLFGAGTAAGLAGANTVFSDDITDGQVRTPDLATSAVTSAKIAPGQVTNADLGGGSVTGAKVADNSLTGVDVNESTLQLGPRAHFARVTYTGTLLSGNALSASQQGAGYYGVTFARNVQLCAATASPEEGYASSVRLGVYTSGSTVYVFVADDLGSPASASFHLVLVCP